MIYFICYDTCQIRVWNFLECGSLFILSGAEGLPLFYFRLANFHQLHWNLRERPFLSPDWRNPHRVKLFGINTYISKPKRASNYL